MPILENSNYCVTTLPIEEQRDGDNYAVTNNRTGCIEQRCATLPQAFLTATQLNRLLETNYHEMIVDSMYRGAPHPDDATIINLFGGDDDGEGELH